MTAHEIKHSMDFGCLSFNRNVMRDRLPQDVFFALQKTIENHEPLDPKLANAIAHGMKEWAIELGATHYSHWFQPLTGFTAEKHDSFLTQDPDGTVFARFSGNQLIMSEPDASSFPSGGMRSTFEARGYTAWDPSSPAFILKQNGAATLCIPSVYFSYNGEALDEKTPLLRSCEVISRAAVRLLHLLGKKDITHIQPMVGAEQEFFLIDKDLFLQRPDLVFCGRTLFGCEPPKGQQMDDHYFGSIPKSVMLFFTQLEIRARQLGIPIKTRHNEVAPQQYEVACLHEHVNIACDHNLLLMELMRLSAAETNCTLILHEKPFTGVNGSGKHNNWSLMDNHGHNLLDPGKEPMENLQFLLFLIAVVQAVHDHADLLQASVAGAGNDLRLGACEAPPAQISVFLGKQLNSILDRIEKGDRSNPEKIKILDLGLNHLPQINIDNTDRNRTSPFAFTGNKFEFRAVSSSMPLGFPNTVLNLAVSDALDKICDHLQHSVSSSNSLEDAVLDTIKHFCLSSRAIRFEGDNYEINRDKLPCATRIPNACSTPDTLHALISDKCIRLFSKGNVLTGEELIARHRIKLDIYAKQTGIELEAMRYIMQSCLLPQGLKCLRQYRQIDSATKEIVEYINDFELDLAGMIKLIAILDQAVLDYKSISDDQRRAILMAELRNGLLSECKQSCEGIERFLGRSDFPLPSYHDLLFSFVR
ncbi:MAG: glutamine synthetase III [Candidatus Cloacimonetes bacterium]|nr:glutamine synthetase III [Candidatus Cloacimonadota bacterium]